MSGPPHALDLTLRLTYPFPPPKVNSLVLLVDGLTIADKHQIEGVQGRLREFLHRFVGESPLRMYAIVSGFRFD